MCLYVKLILAKTELKMKWFIFEYIQILSELIDRSKGKNQFWRQKLQILVSSHNQFKRQNQFYSTTIKYVKTNYRPIETILLIPKVETNLQEQKSNIEESILLMNYPSQNLDWV
jgi:hypothetical protein